MNLHRDATLNETPDGLVVTDEYGHEWAVVACDNSRSAAIERNTGDRWVAAEYTDGELVTLDDGGTYGVTCQDEYVVRDGRWVENV